jgi:type IV pilus assembly protein PilY1
LMELDAMTGAKTTDSSFDFNNDGAFDSGDYLSSGAVASGIKTTVGITKPPAWFTGDSGKDYKVMTGTTGGIQSLGNKGAPPTPPGGGGGILRRTYWLQIQ